MKRSHKNNEARLTVPELVDAFWKSGVYPTKTGVLELVQSAVRNALERHKRKHKYWPKYATVAAALKAAKKHGKAD